MENQKNDNLNLLEAVVQNTEMGKNTLDELMSLTHDQKLRDEMLRQKREYRRINQAAHTALDASRGRGPRPERRRPYEREHGYPAPGR